MKTLLRTTLHNTPAWRLIRGVKRFLTPPRQLVPAGHQRGLINWQNAPPAAETASPLSLHLQIENRSGIAWPCNGRDPVAIRARWLTRLGTPFDQPVRIVPLPGHLYPGEPRTVRTTITTPDVVGDFSLALDFVQGDRVLSEPEQPESRYSITIVGSRSTDIDYHSVYRTANLQQNHWWVVGAYHSKEQYEQSSRERRDMLIRCGLTPDFRVLDIGCGTGQMASALESYLSDKGAYAGTDIGAEAIEFCKQNFQKRNFEFERGGMTNVPFHADGTYDMAIFFSVFTHTFPDETALLLAEAKRLLKPTGTIIADVITSPLVERGAGHRGEMVLNKEYFLKLARMLGYEATVIGRWPWNRHAERFMFQFRLAR